MKKIRINLWQPNRKKPTNFNGMRLLLLSLVINALFGLSTAQICSGVCPAGGTVQNPSAVVTLPGGLLQFCGVVDNDLKTIVDQPAECTSRAETVRNAGCICPGDSPSPVTMSPVTTTTPPPTPGFGFPTQSPSAAGLSSECLGICFQKGSTLQNPAGVSNLPGGAIQFCGVLDNASKNIVNDPNLCASEGLRAQNGGCVCLGPPTAMPSNPTSPTTSAPTALPVPTAAPLPTQAPSQSPSTEISLGDECPGICVKDEFELQNPTGVSNLPGGRIAFCGALDNESKAIVGDPELCISKSAAAQNGGCVCLGPPTTAPTSPTSPAPTTAPVPTVAPIPSQIPSISPSMEALLGLEDECPGICEREGFTLQNPTGLSSLPGGVVTFCGDLDREAKAITGDASLCLSKATQAQNGGCICLGPPTTMPSSFPTTSPEPSATPTGVPTVTPSGSGVPTRTDMPTRVPTTANPTAAPRFPAFCNGVCYLKTDLLFNPNVIAIIRDPDTNVVADIELCANLDARYKEIFADPNTCDSFAFHAQRAGCNCGAPIDCPGICSTDGEVVVNPNLLVTVDGIQSTCGNYDAEWDAIQDPAFCTDIPEKIDIAISAGCKCALPIECSGMCRNEGDVVTTPDAVVSLSDGTTGTCAELDAEFAATLDKDRCDAAPGLIDEAFALGCKCGAPVPCPGICTDGAESVTTPNDIVTLPDGTVGSCAALDEQLKTVIDPATCVSRIDEYLAAGCKCGIPFDCPGVCLNPNNNKIFNKNIEVTNPTTGSLEKCGDIDKNNKDTIIDEEICRERGFEVVQAGCQCGETTSSPSMAPSLTPVPSTSLPSSIPTFNTLRQPSAPTAPSGPTPTAPSGGVPTSALNSGAIQSTSNLMSIAFTLAALLAAAFVVLW